MARRLKMAEAEAIKGLVLKGWSRRKIARTLAVDRETVRRYAKAMAAESNAAISTTGFTDSNPAISNTGILVQNPDERANVILFGSR
jgi:hypothetical protein